MRYSDGKTVYKLRYSTDKNEQRAYYDARAQLDTFLKAEDYIEKQVMSNVDLPYVRTLNKRTK
ncbi:hypothetical protein [Halobacillus sp. Marseille-Q1614]|uniref:hypothetical protein n=1 Tax=Halobacillus sp. Marseille-Q1614 TaxID=2709134 RepID=UPI00156DC6F1|nr:hypothetical protein [Halobacillus sp. Marseille-Q1614]